MHVIATAGHVDHGKSTLVRALTGMEPDRWAEERRRGMTIDLGFAWTSLPDGTQVAFVDGPGHQRFIANLLAGIGPVPAVLLVVAADEGWCRQSAEHLAALDALGVTHGVLAVTRADLGDGELAVSEARAHLAGTSLEGIEAVVVSPVADTGMDELRAAIERMTKALPPPRLDTTRLWVDRVFTIRGAGTVVTGTLGCGTVAVDDELLVVPSGELVHVRSIETLKQQVDSVHAVARVALSLRGAKRSELRRGDALVRPGQWTSADVIDVRLARVPGRVPARPLVHLGSAAVSAYLRMLDDGTARLRLDRPLPLHVGERAILRDPGQQHVITGVEVLDVMPPELGRRGAARARAQELRAMTGGPDLGSDLARRGVARRSELRAAGIDVAALPQGVVAVGDWLIHSQRWVQWQVELVEVVDAWASAHALQPGLPRAAAMRALQVPDPETLEVLVGSVSGLVSDGDGVHRPEVSAALPEPVRRALDAVLERLATDPFDAADAADLAAAGLTDTYLAAAVKGGELVKVAVAVYLAPHSLARAAQVLAALPQPFTLSAARQALGTTRRVAIPLLELLDRQRVTRRVDSQLRTVRVASPS